MKQVGFWRDPSDVDPSEALPDPGDSVEPDWDPVERDAVVRYLRDGKLLDWVKGYSWCRFQCGVHDSEMGDKTLTDGDYFWPEGLPHYLTDHGVKPPGDFVAHVLRTLREREQR